MSQLEVFVKNQFRTFGIHHFHFVEYFAIGVLIDGGSLKLLADYLAALGLSCQDETVYDCGST